MTDIVMALRLRIEDDEAPLHDHELHRHALKAIQELRGKLQTVAEAYTRMNRETGAETERLRTCVKTLTGQLQYIGDIATATAEDAKRWKETK